MEEKTVDIGADNGGQLSVEGANTAAPLPDEGEEGGKGACKGHGKYFALKVEDLRFALLGCFETRHDADKYIRSRGDREGQFLTVRVLSEFGVREVVTKRWGRK